MANKRENPKEGQIYKHFKGSLYEVLALAVHTETEEKLVIYRSVEKPERVFARPVEMFMSEVDRLRYPFIRAKYRFTLMAEVVEAEDDVDEGLEPEEKVSSPKEETDTESEDTVPNTGDECPAEKAEEVVLAGSEANKEEAPLFKEDGTLALDPTVEKILDAKDYTDKISHFEMLRNKCTEDMLTQLAISLDVQLEDGSIEEKYAQILKTLRMHEKYESARLRP